MGKEKDARQPSGEGDELVPGNAEMWFRVIKTRILRLTTLWRWKLCLKPQQRLSDLPSPSRVIKMNRRSLFTVVTFEEGSPASGFLPAGKHFLHCHLASDE
ncbi:hypothetical protein TNIN_499061 [Trichonephila inaurata madagascariensis]|uniref:Uncharacterized protein n=1 Tax=Trichonephila inaurata madagascariensis TaxID=2747483 RepID=A0A8X6WSV7_9ARAC|nr:hypothetical protein TNIN_499061 [Trichonephila inaurata madagascariensis]